MDTWYLKIRRQTLQSLLGFGPLSLKIFDIKREGLFTLFLDNCPLYFLFPRYGRIAKGGSSDPPQNRPLTSGDR